ncbi:hypothetical protein BT69DRAFT_1291480, partial [Atractiella rhizophila]
HILKEAEEIWFKLVITRWPETSELRLSSISWRAYYSSKEEAEREKAENFGKRARQAYEPVQVNQRARKVLVTEIRPRRATSRVPQSGTTTTSIQRARATAKRSTSMHYALSSQWTRS